MSEYQGHRAIVRAGPLCSLLRPCCPAMSYNWAMSSADMTPLLSMKRTGLLLSTRFPSARIPNGSYLLPPLHSQCLGSPADSPCQGFLVCASCHIYTHAAITNYCVLFYPNTVKTVHTSTCLQYQNWNSGNRRMKMRSSRSSLAREQLQIQTGICENLYQKKKNKIKK